MSQSLKNSENVKPRPVIPPMGTAALARPQEIQRPQILIDYSRVEAIQLRLTQFAGAILEQAKAKEKIS